MATGNTAVYEQEVVPEVEPIIEVVEMTTANPVVEEKIIEAFPDNYKLMISVAHCESGLNQAAVSHTNDYGVFQVNEASWDLVAQEMGLDYKNNVDDNIKMAQHILEVQGINAWVCYTDNLLALKY